MVNHNFHKTVSHVSLSPAVSWQTKLQEWVSQATAGENRAEAARRIERMILIESGSFEPVKMKLTDAEKRHILKMSQLGLTSLPPKAVLSRLSMVKTLLLTANRLKSFEEGSFHGWTSLTSLDLEDNQLETLTPGLFSGLSELTELVLSKNDIRVLTAGTFVELPALDYLHLCFNHIQSIELGAFAGLTAVKYLNLSANLLQRVEPGWLSGLPALTLLLFGFNQIQRVEVGAFVGVPPGTQICLDSNPIQTLEAGMFEGVNPRLIFTFSDSSISTLPDVPAVFRGLGADSRVYLDSNPISLATAERITAYNAEPGTHPTITFTNFDANVRAEDALISPERPLSVHVKQWLPDLSPEDAALWMALQEAKPQEASALATFLTRLFNECPRQEGKVDTKLTEKIYDLLTSIQEALKKDFEESIKPDSFVMRCLSNARLGNGTCIDKVKVAYVLNQYEVQRHHLGKMAPTSVVTSKREEVEAKIKLIHHTINFVSQVAHREVFFDNQLKEFVTLEEAVGQYNQDHPDCALALSPDEEYAGNMETFGGDLLINLLSLTGDRYRVVIIGDEAEDVLKLTYELTNKDPFIHQVDMRFESCCTIGKNPEYLKAALAYLARTHENPSSLVDRQPIPAG